MKIYQKELRVRIIEDEKDVKTLLATIGIKCKMLERGGTIKTEHDKIDYLTNALSNNQKWNYFRRTVRMMENRIWERVENEALKEEIDLLLQGEISNNKEKVLESNESKLKCFKCLRNGQKKEDRLQKQVNVKIF